MQASERNTVKAQNVNVLLTITEFLNKKHTRIKDKCKKETIKMKGYDEKINKLKEEMDFKQMEENYSYVVDQAKSEFLHRGDVHQATR